MAFLKTTNGAGLVNGTTLITLTGSIDASKVVPGTAIFLNGNLLEGISGTAPDGGGNSTITIRDASVLTTIVAGNMNAFNTFEGINEALAVAEQVTTITASLRASFGLLLTSTNVTESINIDGVMTAFTPYQYLIDQLANIANGGLMSTKGDLVAYSTDAARFPVGANDFVLTADSTATFGFAWKAAGASGEINTASNVGVGGTTIFKQKTALDLEFNSINGLEGVSAILDSPNNKIDVKLDIPALAADATPDGAADYVVVQDASAGVPKKVLLNNLPATGEVNTASNVGVAGISVFKQKAALDLEFNSVKGGAGVKTSLDAANNEIDIELDINALTADATPDSAADYGVIYDASASAHKKVLLSDWPGGGGGAAASINGLKPGVGFLMCGEIAGNAGRAIDSAMTGKALVIDFIFFPTETTISEVSVRSATASTGGTITVGLHPMTDRLSLGTQDFVASISVSTVANTTHTDVLSTAWVVPAGWYGLVSYPGTSTLTNIISRSSNGNTGNSGRHFSGIAQIYSNVISEAEVITIYMFTETYIASPDLTSIDFNDPTIYKDAPIQDELEGTTLVPIVHLKVTAS